MEVMNPPDAIHMYTWPDGYSRTFQQVVQYQDHPSGDRTIYSVIGYQLKPIKIESGWIELMRQPGSGKVGAMTYTIAEEPKKEKELTT